MADELEYWFPAKRYGWGWGIPVTWQGWAVIVVYVLFVLLAVITVPPIIYPLWFLIVLVLLNAMLFIICWLKGEPLRWRGGRQ
ncbi:MAG: hypothetical protein KGI54_17800 [Pseudomonadota bacterium]|nr:hypothetical protein [Pseudomonadota bacterium]